MHLMLYRSKHFVFLSPNFNSPQLSSVISKQDNMAKGTKNWDKLSSGENKMNGKNQQKKTPVTLSSEALPYKSFHSCEAFGFH